MNRESSETQLAVEDDVMSVASASSNVHDIDFVNVTDDVDDNVSVATNASSGAGTTVGDGSESEAELPDVPEEDPVATSALLSLHDFLSKPSLGNVSEMARKEPWLILQFVLGTLVLAACVIHETPAFDHTMSQTLYKAGYDNKNHVRLTSSIISTLELANASRPDEFQENLRKAAMGWFPAAKDCLMNSEHNMDMERVMRVLKTYRTCIVFEQNPPRKPPAWWLKKGKKRCQVLWDFWDKRFKQCAQWNRSYVSSKHPPVSRLLPLSGIVRYAFSTTLNWSQPERSQAVAQMLRVFIKEMMDRDSVLHKYYSRQPGLSWVLSRQAVSLAVSQSIQSQCHECLDVLCGFYPDACDADGMLDHAIGVQPWTENTTKMVAHIAKVYWPYMGTLYPLPVKKLEPWDEAIQFGYNEGPTMLSWKLAVKHGVDSFDKTSLNALFGDTNFDQSPATIQQRQLQQHTLLLLAVERCIPEIYEPFFNTSLPPLRPMMADSAAVVFRSVEHQCVSFIQKLISREWGRSVIQDDMIPSYIAHVARNPTKTTSKLICTLLSAHSSFPENGTAWAWDDYKVARTLTSYDKDILLCKMQRPSEAHSTISKCYGSRQTTDECPWYLLRKPEVGNHVRVFSAACAKERTATGPICRRSLPIPKALMDVTTTFGAIDTEFESIPNFLMLFHNVPLDIVSSVRCAMVVWAVDADIPLDVPGKEGQRCEVLGMISSISFSKLLSLYSRDIAKSHNVLILLTVGQQVQKAVYDIRSDFALLVITSTAMRDMIMTAEAQIYTDLKSYVTDATDNLSVREKFPIEKFPSAPVQMVQTLEIGNNLDLSKLYTVDCDGMNDRLCMYIHAAGKVGLKDGRTRDLRPLLTEKWKWITYIADIAFMVDDATDAMCEQKKSSNYRCTRGTGECLVRDLYVCKNTTFENVMNWIVFIMDYIPVH